MGLGLASEHLAAHLTCTHPSHTIHHHHFTQENATNDVANNGPYTWAWAWAFLGGLCQLIGPSGRLFGYTCALLLGLTSVAKAMLNSHYNWRLVGVGMKLEV